MKRSQSYGWSLKNAPSRLEPMRKRSHCIARHPSRSLCPIGTFVMCQGTVQWVRACRQVFPISLHLVECRNFLASVPPTNPKGGLVRGYVMINQYNPIHGSCAIYFPGGIVIDAPRKVLKAVRAVLLKFSKTVLGGVLLIHP